jgi:hypothetical protein
VLAIKGVILQIRLDRRACPKNDRVWERHGRLALGIVGRWKIAEVKGDGDVERLIRGSLVDGSKFQQERTPPLRNRPVRCLEVGGTLKRADGGEIERGEEKWIGELVSVDKEVGGESEVGV